MTTLEKEAYVIKDRLAGGEDNLDNKTDVRDIIMVYRDVMKDELMAVWYANMNVGDRSQIPMYIATYAGDDALEVVEDTTGFMKATLKELYSELPYNKGIVRVFPNDNPKVEIIRSNNPNVSSNLPWVVNMEKKPSYYIEGIELKIRENNWNENWKKVGVKQLIPAPESLAEDAILPIMPGQKQRIRERVTNYFLGQGPQDVLNDGNKNRGVTMPE